MGHWQCAGLWLWSSILAIALVLLAAAVALAPLVETLSLGLGELQEKDPPPASATALVVLGYKLHPDGALWPPLRFRVEVAAKELLAGTARTVVFSGGIPPGREGMPSEARAMENHMLNCHSEALSMVETVLLEESSGSTRENAARSLALLRERAPGVTSLVVVTNSFHQLRAARVFRRAAGTQFAVRVAATVPASIIMGADSAQLSLSRPMLSTTLAAVEHSTEACPSDKTQVWGGRASASSVHSLHLSHYPCGAFDNSTASSWHSATGMPQWLEYEIPNPPGSVEVCSYSLRSRAEACRAQADAPMGWDVIGDPESASAAVLHSISHVEPWGPGEQRAFAFASPKRVRRMRWVFNKVSGRKRFVVLGGAALLLNCSGAVVLNSSARVDVFAPWNVSCTAGDGWRDCLAESLGSLQLWTWHVDLAWEVSRELLAILWYALHGWL